MSHIDRLRQKLDEIGAEVAVDRIASFFENCEAEQRAWTYEQWKALVDDYVIVEERLEVELVRLRQEATLMRKALIKIVRNCSPASSSWHPSSRSEQAWKTAKNVLVSVGWAPGDFDSEEAHDE